MAEYLDLQVQRNATLSRTLAFTDAEGAPLDLTGVTFTLGVKYAAGAAGGRIASGSVTAIDAVNGLAQLSIRGSLFNSVPGEMEIVTLAYDLLGFQDNEPMALARGALFLLPGVS